MDLDDLYRLLRGAHVQAQGVVDTVRDPLLVLDAQLCVMSANRAFYDVFGVGRDETIGNPLYELGEGQWDIEELRLLLEKVIPRTAAVTDYEVDADFPHIGRRTMLVSARRLAHPDRSSRTLLLSIVDATERRKKEEENRVFIGELQHRMKNLLGLVHALARQTDAAHEEARQVERAVAVARGLHLGQRGPPCGARGPNARALRRRPLRGGRRWRAGGGAEAGAGAAGRHDPARACDERDEARRLVGRGWPRPGEDLEENGSGAARVRLRWDESGGPEAAAPDTRGFGTRLIEFAAAQELGGTAELTFASEGLRSEVQFPL